MTVCVLGGFYAFFSLRNQPESTHKLRVGDTVLQLEVLGNGEFVQGLSGRSDLPSDRAVLFDFTETATRCFWMKDMRFAIDMVWLDADKKVVAVEHEVAPESYPNEYCHEGQYVVEWNAGMARQLGVSKGTALTF